MAPSIETIELKSFESILESADVDQLCILLTDLNLAHGRKMNPIQVNDINRRRVDLSNRLLTLKLTPKQRELAIGSKIEALAAIYGLEFELKIGGPNVSESLRTAAEEYSMDTNPKISRVARQALLKHNAFERLKKVNRPNVKLVADEMIALLKDHPNDEITLTTIDLITSYYVSKQFEEGVVLFEQLSAASPGMKSTKLDEILSGASDQVALQSLGYLESFENRWVKDAAGQQAMVQDSIELLSDPNYGDSIVRTVDMVTQWFEQEGKYDRAIEIYQKMLSSAESNQNPEASALARKIAEFGLARSKLVNQKIDLSGVSPNETPIDPKMYEQRVVIVVFWAFNDNASKVGLNQVYVETKDLRRQGLRLVAVSLDQVVGDDQRRFMASMRDVVFVVGDAKKNGENLIWDQCPSTYLPRAMLVNKTGVVVDINVPIDEIRTEAGFLITE